MARPSHVRDGVAGLVRGSSRHDWSADELLHALRAEGVRADASSVFRSLSRLVMDGALRRVELGDGVARYEAAGEHHEHVRCQRCGTVDAVPGCVVEDVKPEVERATGFRLTGHSVLFTGLCGTCAAGAA